MKRLVICLSIITLVMMLSPYFSILAQHIYIPHQNPATAEDASDTTSLLLFYGNVFNLATLRQYLDAQNMLSELEWANIPDEIRYLVDRYNDLSQQLFTAMNNLEFILGKASALFSKNQFVEARQVLDSAEVAVRDTVMLLEDTETATDAMSDKLGVFTSIAGSELSLAYERLKGILERLRQIIDELDKLRQNLSDNPQIVINTFFYLTTLLEVSAPDIAYPGLPFIINGQVSSSDGIVERMVEVFLDDIQLADGTTRGQFSFQVIPPQQISTGKHDLDIVVTPQGHYSGTSQRLSIDISRLPIQLDIQLPRVSFFSNSVQIRGKVYQSGRALEDAEVQVTLKQVSTLTKTSGSGTFTTAVNMPFDLLLIGPQELTITVQPAEAWFSSLSVKRWVLNINAANLILMLVIFVSLGILIYSRVRARPSRVHQEIVMPRSMIQELAAIRLSTELKYESTSIRGRILSAYLDGLSVVEKVTGISMEPHITLREFLKISTPRLQRAVNSFTELTVMAEIALYSSHDLTPTIAGIAEQIAAAIKEEFTREAS